MKSTEEFWSKRQHTDSSAMESWILSRQNDLVMGKGFFLTFIFLISETTIPGALMEYFFEGIAPYKILVH